MLEWDLWYGSKLLPKVIGFQDIVKVSEAALHCSLIYSRGVEVNLTYIYQTNQSIFILKVFLFLNQRYSLNMLLIQHKSHLLMLKVTGGLWQHPQLCSYFPFQASDQPTSNHTDLSSCFLHRNPK